MQRFLQQLAPFIFIGIALVAFALGIMLLAYLFLFGALLGLGLFILNWIKNKFLAPKKPTRTVRRQEGRVIDSDDWKKL
jgi:hypothetical protein